MQKYLNKDRHRPYHLHKNELKMSYRPNCKTQNKKIVNITGKNLDDFGHVSF